MKRNVGDTGRPSEMLNTAIPGGKTSSVKLLCTDGRLYLSRCCLFALHDGEVMCKQVRQPIDPAP